MKQKTIFMVNLLRKANRMRSGYGLSVLFIMAFLLGSVQGWGQTTNTWNGSANSNWNNASNWSLNQVPTSSHDVVIPDNFSVTVNTNAECNTLVISSGGNSNTISFGASSSLTVSGAITINAGSGSGDNKIINVGSRTLTCGSISIADTGNNNRDSEIQISTGILNVNGNIVMNGGSGRNAIRFTDAGILNIKGTITGGALVPSSGTVNYNNSGAQTVGTYVYNNLTLSGSGQKTVTGATINGTLSLQGTATATGTSPTYGGSAILEYKGSAAQTTSNVEFPATLGADLIVNNSAGVTLNAAKTVTGFITLSSGALSSGNFDLSLTGNWTNNSSFNAGTGTVSFTGTGDQSIAGSSSTTFNDLTFSGTGGTKTFSLNTTIVGTMDISGANTVLLNSTSTQRTHTVKNFTMSAGTLDGGSTDVSGNTTSILNISGDFDKTGGIITNTSQNGLNSFIFNGGITQTISLNTSADAFLYTPISVKNNTTLELNSNLEFALFSGTRLTIDNGSTFNAKAFIISHGTTTSTVIDIQGKFITANPAGFSGANATAILSTITQTITLGSASEIEYNATTAQTVTPRADYANVTLSGAGIKTFATTPTISGVLSMEGTASVVVNGAGVITYGANATLQYNKPSAYTATSEEWVTPFSATGGIKIINTGEITNANTVTVSSGISGSGTLVNTGTLNIGGTCTVTNLIATANGNIVNYNGTTAQTVKGTVYHHLNLSEAGAKTLGAETTVNGDMSSASALNLSTFNLNMKGDFTTSGNISGSGNLVFNGGGVRQEYSRSAGTWSGIGLTVTNNSWFQMNSVTTSLSVPGTLSINPGSRIGIMGTVGTNISAGAYNWGSATFIYNNQSTAQQITNQIPVTGLTALVIDNPIGCSFSTTTNVSISSLSTNSLTINSGAKLNLASGNKLSLTGSANSIVNNGTLTLADGATLVQENNITVQNTNGVSNNTGSGNYIVHRSLSGSGGTTPNGRFWYVGTPVVGATSAVFDAQSANDFREWSEALGGWFPINNNTTELIKGKGYMYRGTASTTVAFNTSVINNGNVPITLSRTASSPKPGFNLVSNPYPSHLSWNSLYQSTVSNNTSNVVPTIWYRTANSNGTMIFDTFNASMNVGTNNNGTQVTATIAPFQAFWVRLNEGTSLTMTATNAMRSHGTQNFLTLTPATVRLNISNGSYHDETIVVLNEDLSNDYDYRDSDKEIPSTTVHQLYSLEGSTRVAINGIANALAKDSLKLGVQIPTAGTYSINCTELTFSDMVFLEDKLTGSYLELNSTTNYSFTSVAGTFNNRFVLHFAPFVPALPGQTAATAIAMPTSNWPQCNNVTTEDQWHAFTATSEGISIEVNTATADLTIELQDGTGNVVAQENAVNGIGNETLNFFGLTAGQTYKVGVRNNISSQPTGTYGICVKSLKRGGCDYGAGPYSLCQYYKATWAGSTGVSYTFTFTGTSGPAAGQTFTRTQNSDICVLSTVTPLLPYGSTYDVVISNTYTLTDGAGNTEQITVPSINGCQVITIAEPQTALSNSSSCNNGARFRGAVVSSMPWVCGSNNWRWRFTEVNPLTMQEVGLPIELNRGSASNYLSLGTVSQLQNGKTYAVQTAPIFNYTGTNYNWGPTQYLCIVGAAGMTLEGADAAQEQAQGSNKLLTQDVSQVDAMVYVTEGNQLNIQLTNTESNTAKRADIYDVTGKLVKSVRLVEGMNQVTLTETTGIYMVRTVVGNQSETTRVFVNN